MRLVGNEVGALYLVDGLNLGESCQVFVIKDLIIHFSLGKRKGTGKRQRDKREKREETKTRHRGKSFSSFHEKQNITRTEDAQNVRIRQVLEAIPSNRAHTG